VSLKALRSKTYLRARVARVEAGKKGVRRARHDELDRCTILQRREGSDQIPGVAVLKPVDRVDDPCAIHLGGQPEPLIVLGPADLRIRKLDERVHPVDVPADQQLIQQRFEQRR